MTIHSSAIVAPAACLGAGVEVGPFCVIGENVTLADGVRVHSHVVIGGNTIVGEGTEIFPFASIGLIPQDKKYGGEESRLVIGSGNVIREHVTMNPGTGGGGGVTRVGRDGLYMVGSHVAHDCLVGDRVVLANNATLGGHVTVGNDVILGGLTAVHQFVRIGDHAFVGGMAGVRRDVIPYGHVAVETGYLAGLNIVGLRRRGFQRESISRLMAAFRVLFLETGELAEKVEALGRDSGDDACVAALISFLTARSDRRFLMPRDNPHGDAD